MFVAPLPDVTVQFNQPVDRASAEASFALGPKGAADGVAGSFQWPDDRTLIFRPAQPLPLQTAFEAVVKAGVKSLGAAATMATEMRWTFTTVGVPRVVATEPADGDQHASSGQVRITFSNPMDQPSVESAITVIPKPGDTPYFYWDPGQFMLSMSLSMTPSTAYRVILTTDARDRYGQPLAQGLDLSFVTDQVQPGFRIFRTSRSGTFNAYLDPRVMLSSWNLGQLDLQLYSVDRADLITAESGFNPQGYHPPATGLLRTWSESIQDPPLNLPVTTATRLAADGATLPEGVYFLRVTAPQAARGFDDMFFVVSSANVVTKWTQRDLLLWIVDMSTGAPLAGLPIQVLDRSANAVAAATTDQDGLARVDVPGSMDSDLYRGYYVWAQVDGRTVLAGTSLERRHRALELPEQHQLPVQAARTGRLRVHRPPHLPAGRDRLLQGRCALRRRRQLLRCPRGRSHAPCARRPGAPGR